GTTIAATAAIADLTGIPVVATGGIGGVHLGAEQTWDVSADLRALAEYPVAVVCAGAKAICDIGKTLEYLDTAGVPVVVYRADRSPNFYARDSGFSEPRPRTRQCRIGRRRRGRGLKGLIVRAMEQTHQAGGPGPIIA